MRITLCLMTFLFANIVFAQSIILNETKRVNLQGTSYLKYDLWINFGTQVVIETSGDMDTVVELRNSSGSVITSDDDGGVNRNSRIVANMGTGNFVIAIRGYSSSDQGEVKLLVSGEVQDIDDDNDDDDIEEDDSNDEEIARWQREVRRLENKLRNNRQRMQNIRSNIEQTTTRVDNWDQTVSDANARLPRVNREISNLETQINSLKRQEATIVGQLQSIDSRISQLPRACLTASVYNFGTGREVTAAVRRSAYGAQLGSDDRVAMSYDDATLSKVCEIVGFRTVASSKKHRVSSCRDNPMATYKSGSDSFEVKPPCDLRKLIKRLSCTDRFTPVVGCSQAQLTQLENLQRRKSEVQRSLQSKRNEISRAQGSLNTKVTEKRELKRTIDSSEAEFRRLRRQLDQLRAERQECRQIIEETQSDLEHARQELRRAGGNN